MMTECGTAIGTVDHPTSSGRFHRITCEWRAVHLLARQHVVTIGIVSPAYQ
jgi:hypothetical protein